MNKPWSARQARRALLQRVRRGPQKMRDGLLRKIRGLGMRMQLAPGTRMPRALGTRMALAPGMRIPLGPGMRMLLVRLPKLRPGPGMRMHLVRLRKPRRALNVNRRRKAASVHSLRRTVVKLVRHRKTKRDPAKREELHHPHLLRRTGWSRPIRDIASRSEENRDLRRNPI